MAKIFAAWDTEDSYPSALHPPFKCSYLPTPVRRRPTEAQLTLELLESHRAVPAAVQLSKDVPDPVHASDLPFGKQPPRCNGFKKWIKMVLKRKHFRLHLRTKKILKKNKGPSCANNTLTKIKQRKAKRSQFLPLPPSTNLKTTTDWTSSSSPSSEASCCGAPLGSPTPYPFGSSQWPCPRKRLRRRSDLHPRGWEGLL